ncbi:Methyl-accepting chemotaxis protein [Duganella sacchari]|uniref:Methyl-accepting chemotaxis protein n=1 Tax=Duganella sacchari TaxID=551987 RepID=A0A1M7R8K5_9BURK|nr:methyl-accepting chemotaxis protein [Duganella sacchari]SHN42665.1 Methyl-accepting chemotaxis protein [Duganella sacchari]
MRFSDFGITRKLYLGFGAVVVILAVLLGSAYTNFERLVQANGWNNHTHEVMAETQSILASLINMETGERGYALTGEQASLAPLNAGKSAFEAHLQQARKLTADNPTQQERLQKLAQAQQAWYASAIEPALAMRAKANDGASIDPLLNFEREGRGRAGMDSMRALLDEISGAEAALLGKRAADAASLQSLTANTIIIGGLLTIVLATALAWILSRSIVGPLSDAVRIARTVASGDLRSHIEARSQDETGQMLQALGDMNQSLLNIVGEVRRGTDTIATATSEIARGNQDLSTRTEQQASSLEETASSMEELTGTVKQNADNARQANQLAASASEVASKGGAVVAQVVETMQSISASSQNIVEIISVIDGIAFQTNILALNAAVEAARAGEQGRGFAVVASEVRTLAQRSAAAAREIKALIVDSVDKVDAGSKLVEQAGITMEEIVGSVQRVTTIMQDIASASEEQIAGIEQINQAISQMDNVTQQNAALVEQAAAAAAALQEQAASQAHVVSVFKLDTRYAAAVSAPPASPAAPRLAPAQPARAKAAALSAPAAPTAPAAASAPAARAPRSTTKAGGDEWEEF